MMAKFRILSAEQKTNGFLKFILQQTWCVFGEGFSKFPTNYFACFLTGRGGRCIRSAME
jgi:hypothetical protein